jgi:hypothetical protein
MVEDEPVDAEDRDDQAANRKKNRGRSWRLRRLEGEPSGRAGQEIHQVVKVYV